MSVIAYAIFTSCQGKNIKVCGLSVFFLNQFFKMRTITRSPKVQKFLVTWLRQSLAYFTVFTYKFIYGPMHRVLNIWLTFDVVPCCIFITSWRFPSSCTFGKNYMLSTWRYKGGKCVSSFPNKVFPKLSLEYSLNIAQDIFCGLHESDGTKRRVKACWF